VKEKKVKIFPGHDGLYGKVTIFEEEKREEPEQMSLL